MRAQLLNQKTGEHRIGADELLEVWKSDPNTVLWADYESVAAHEREAHLEGIFELHPLAVDDALRARHPPKCEHFRRHLLVRIRGLDPETDGIDFKTIDISIFLRARLMVTKRTGNSINTDAIWREVTHDPTPLEAPAQLAVNLIGRIVRRYLSILLDFEPRLEELELEIFETQDDAMLKELTRYKTRLKQLRRIFQYHLLVMTSLQSHPIDYGVEDPEQLKHQIVDVRDQVQRALSLSELYYELISDLVDAFLALSSHRLNQIMQVLTIVTVIFVPLGLLAGIYGMNFEYIPELKTRYGYFVLLTIMAVIVTFQLAYFKRRGWIWSR